jgi:dTMP kinase
MEEGFFISFEGTEGTGKSTQADLLAKELRLQGRGVVLTREPGGTRLGGELRKILLGLTYEDLSVMSELFLYMADRAQHMAEVIIPSLQEGKIVICDRFTDATVAYQGFGRGISRERIEALNREATSGRFPDLTVLLDLQDVTAGLCRALKRNEEKGLAGAEDRFEKEETAFHCRVRDGYRSVAEAEPGRFAVFSAALPVDDLQRRILGRVLQVLPPGEGNAEGA